MDSDATPPPAPSPGRHRRKPVEEMTGEELRALVVEMRERTESLNEEMRVLQNQIKVNSFRNKDHPTQ